MTTTLALPPQHVEQMARLARFHRNVRWTGTIQPGSYGPGSPALTTIGEARYRTIQNGLWILGEHEQDVYLTDGTFVRHTQLHWIAGWDPETGEYQASTADSEGHFTFLTGHIAGRLLTFDSIGHPRLRTRLFWHVADAETMTWRTEVSVEGGPYELVERNVCTTL
ncbi:DUF1579 family protein [Kribbella shirazensis]|uniref:DUF1579 domain-containing protein n=1 Tax=Kribbella shirazensis TaxID=1105143 RepID=A0A7X5VDA6_9ACTN|nr:DUF1579 family protein [Kribbella shirazensis]NIK59130.1 hypothetical protein [Kribbella shirazensis]